MNNPVGWFEIYVDDLARAKRFYESVFKCELEQLPSPDIEMWAFPADHNAPGSPGTLVKMDDCPAGNNSVVVYFSCEDCATEQALASDNGGSVFREKFSIGEYGFIALVQDTEGNTIGLHSNK